MLAFEQQLWGQAQTKLIAAREIMDVIYILITVIDEIQHLNSQLIIQGKNRPVRPNNQVLQLQNLQRQRHVHRLNHLNEKNRRS
jgi:hypothetical protein